jgi:hypothetical protein
LAKILRPSPIIFGARCTHGHGHRAAQVAAERVLVELLPSLTQAHSADNLLGAMHSVATIVFSAIGRIAAQAQASQSQAPFASIEAHVELHVRRLPFLFLGNIHSAFIILKL